MKRIDKENIWKELSLEDLIVEIDGVEVAEEWKWIDFIENIPKDFYLVSNLGRVKSVDRLTKGKWGLQKAKGQMLKQRLDKDDYLKTSFSYGKYYKQIGVSRVVSFAFIPNPDNLPFVCHDDDITTHNWVSNLWWGTHQDNEDDKTKKGRRKVGEDLPHSKLKESEVIEIRSLTTLSSRELAVRFGVCRTTIKNIRNNRVWNNDKKVVVSP